MEYYKNRNLENINYFCEIDKIWKIEEWKHIPGYENKYAVSDLGRVKSLSRKKTNNGNHQEVKEIIMKQYVNPKGYCTVCVYINANGKTKEIQLFVAKAFIPNLENKPQVNHIDGIKNNNKLNNLEWNTCKENINHAWRTGLRKKQLGEECSSVVLTEKDVLEIRAIGSNLTQKEIAKIYRVSRSNIGLILNRLRWSHI